jgi:hypothetical protein
LPPCKTWKTPYLAQRRLYHNRRNSWINRKAFHLTSVDGINDWIYQGIAYDPTTDFLRYTDGTVNHWNKIERPGVYIEDGHVKAFTFAPIDVEKDQDQGNDTHGSKVLVVPFDGAAWSRSSKAPQPAAGSAASPSLHRRRTPAGMDTTLPHPEICRKSGCAMFCNPARSGFQNLLHGGFGFR